MLTENKAYELATAAKATIINGKLMVMQGISPDLLDEIKAHKDDLKEYLSGHCFKLEVSLSMAPQTWVVSKVSNIGDVMYAPVEVYRGTAHEVDVWCKENSADPFFTDKYTSKYVIGYL